MNARLCPLVLSCALLMLALALLLLTMPVQAAPAAALTVCPAGPPDCEYDNLQDAVNASTTGDVIKVAGGLYTGINNDGGHSQVVSINKMVTIRGGYAAPGFAEPPNPAANPTTLDAEGQGRVIYVAEGGMAQVEGVRITGGDAAGLGGYMAPWGTEYDTGGGIYVLTATLVLSDSQVFSNSAPLASEASGGGIAALNSHVEIVASSVHDNEGGRGGGMSLRKTTADLSKNTLSGNSAGRGGGIYAYGGKIVLQDSAVISNAADWSGGGLHVESGDITVRRTTMAYNSAPTGEGGGMTLRRATVTLEGSEILSNTAQSEAGGAFLEDCSGSITTSRIDHNQAWYGGGLYLVRTNAVVDGNTITANDANYRHGGGAYVSGGDLAITGNTIANNHAAFFGGGLYLTGTIGTVTSNAVLTNTAWQGGGLLLEKSPMTIAGNRVAGNVLAEDTGWGAGIVLWGSDATLARNRISHNVGYWSGGGVAMYNSDATLEGNTVLHNAARFGGGIFAEHSDSTLVNTIVADNQATDAGGGVWVSGYGSAWLAHSTVARNTAGDGSGVYAATSSLYGDTGVWLTNTILVGHAVGVVVEAGSTATLEATLWGAGAWANGADWAGEGVIVTGTVNVRGDPAFVDPDAGDYHIGPGSAAIDAGVEAGVHVDVDGQPRPNQLPDLGADEYWMVWHVYVPMVVKSQ